MPKIIESAIDAVHHWKVLYVIACGLTALAICETISSLHYSKPGRLICNTEPIWELALSNVSWCVFSLLFQVFMPQSLAWILGELASEAFLLWLRSF